MRGSCHVQMICQTQVGHLGGRLGVSPGPGFGSGRNFNLGVIKLFFAVIIRMVIRTSKMFFSYMSFNGSDAFDSSDPAARISALIDHFLQEEGKKANVESCSVTFLPRPS